MYRLIVLGTGVLCATSALAGQVAAQVAGPSSNSASQPVSGAQAVSVASVSAAPDKVYPPLPTLTMIPPAAEDDEDAAPRPTAHKKKVRVAEHRLATPPARLVVSDASRAYLGGIERQIDLALNSAPPR
jgi:hypothetical protein